MKAYLSTAADYSLEFAWALELASEINPRGAVSEAKRILGETEADACGPYGGYVRVGPIETCDMFDTEHEALAESLAAVLPVLDELADAEIPTTLEPLFQERLMMTYRNRATNAAIGGRQ